MSDDHKRGVKKGEFCTVPGTPCECGNNYIKVCEPGWAGSTFQRLVKAAAGSFSFAKKYEAHHLLCVASVTSELSTNKDIENIIEQTEWCINHGPNMLAMPLWGHTVKHYCSITASGGAMLGAAPGAPPFANIPQHDWDHNCKLGYTHEVNVAMKKLAKETKDRKHKGQPSDIAGDLGDASDDFKSILDARGNRDSGTHEAWKKGIDDPIGRWYVPFSMASTAALTEKGFPVRQFDTRVAKWIDRIAAAMRG